MERTPGRLAAVASGQLPYADFFRALAIFYVFIAHAGGLANEPHLFHHVALSEAVTVFDGVAMLFCLSGFLLSAPLLRAYLDTPATLPLVRPYLLARFLRIYPLYAAAVIAIAGYLALSGKPPALGDVALHLAMLQNFLPATIQSLSGPLWTMPLDIQFYLVLPLCFALIARGTRERSERERIAILFGALGIAIVASVVYRFAMVWHFAPAGLDQQLFIVDQFPGMAALFAFGIAARFACLLADRAGLRVTGTAVFGLVVAAVACRWVQYGAHGAWLHLATSASHLRPALFASVDEAIGGAGCACLLVAANYVRDGWFGRIVASPIVAFAAAISYGLYLFHYTVLTGLHERFGREGFVALLVLALLALAILVPLCSATHFGIEKWFLDRKARLKRTRAPAVPGAS